MKTIKTFKKERERPQWKNLFSVAIAILKLLRDKFLFKETFLMVSRGQKLFQKHINQLFFS